MGVSDGVTTKPIIMKRIILFSFFSLLIFSSCHYLGGKRVSGNGTIKSETRTAGSFTVVGVSGNIDVYIKQDSVRSIKVEADENLLQYIEVIEKGEELVIRNKDGYNLKPSKDIKVYVSSPAFKKLEASGSCAIYSENMIHSAEAIVIDLSGSCDVKMDLNTPKVEADLSGACSVQLKGETKDLNIEGSGSTNIKCMDLLAENVDVDISGAGDAEVYASVKLNVSVSGSGDVKYKGNATVSQSVSGAGSVKKVE